MNDKRNFIISDIFSENIMVKSFIYENYSYLPHSHDFWELNIVTKGKGTHILDDKEIDICRGDVFVITPGVSHAYKNYSNLDIYHMVIHPNFIGKYLYEITNWSGFISLFETEPYMRHLVHETFSLKLTEDEMTKVLYDISVLDVYEKANISMKETLKNNCALNLISFLCFCMSRHTGDSQKLYNNRNIAVNNCLNYIHTHYNEKITIDDLAKICFLSKSTLLRYFRDMFNITPWEYIMKVRLDNANRLISTTDKKLTDIATECGFYDYSHLKKYL